ncbi:MAG: hypothetical protein P4M09_16745 [Devosia sp.]|nr:hypothetical protein [Devosia sp.]
MTRYVPSLYVRISHRFHSRRTEWTAGVQSVIWGLVLLAPGNVFDFPAFIIFRGLIDERLMGWGMVGLGVLRLIGLIVNGARKEVTPWIRVGTAFLGCGVFTSISMGLAASGVWSTWLAAWPVLAVTELFNIHGAMRDAKVSNG